MPALSRRLAVARGDEPADLVIRGAKVFSVFTREWLDGDLAIADGFVAGIGDYDGNEALELSGRYLVPGLIDAHMHLESSKLLVDEFARLVLPLGTTAVVADPHEIANVLGTDGVHWLADLCHDLPLDVFFMASSCVPASAFESPRRPLLPGDLEGLLRRRRVLGLAEMMNFPGVISGSEAELEKLALPGATHVDGHAPAVLGKALNAYAAAGIRSDHEMSTIEEGRERLRAGMWVLIREASGARNLQALLPLVHEAVAAGVAAEDALVMASFNPAQWHGLRELGALAPGYQADVLVLRDLERFHPELVLKAGKPVREIPKPEVPEWVRHTVRIRALSTNDFVVPWQGNGRARVIGIVPDQIVTDSLTDEPRVDGGKAVSDPERDLLKIAVVERHLGTGRVGLGFVRGFGLRSGALASTVAHDAHNVVVVGVKDDDMLRAVRRLADTGGGVVVVDRGIVKAELKLPVAGLLSDATLEEVVEASRGCVDAARELGCRLASPFQSMAFLALSVIPSLKITDRGLVDVDRFELVPLQA